MTAYDLLGLFLVMSALAAIPSASVALVVVRSATVNVRNGIATAVGVVAGDLIFIAMAMMGLVALSEIMGAFFAMHGPLPGRRLPGLARLAADPSRG